MFVLDDTEVRAPSTAGPGSDARPVVIENVTPLVDGGRFAYKRVVGDEVEVEADVFREGHDLVAVELHVRAGDGTKRTIPMSALGNDRWRASFHCAYPLRYAFSIEGRPDPFSTWQRDTRKKVEAGDPVGLELDEGAALLVAAVERACGDLRMRLEELSANVARADSDARARILLSEAIARAISLVPDRSGATVSGPFEVDVDRERASFGAWYEMFPRSYGPAGTHGTLADAARRLPAIAAMGFDVVYLPPIHPIGHAFRKGKNNALVAGPDDPGSPWAIGNESGGHTAIEPKLGTFEHFAAFVATARELKLEVALDFALQCSPDHPWVREHPEWFAFRSDGSIKYAENPPKKYQDIVNFNWYGPGAATLWKALRDVIVFWVDRGVTIFRVDNPHTKPFAFWEWMIRDVRSASPGVIFLSEAFTRPKIMYRLAKAGFAQSYTYFTWRNTKEELTEYALELAGPDLAAFFRPNLWPNTPDILPPSLQTGGRAAFVARLVLAATLGSNYGIYGGYELCENAALPGREEYANSEKYELKRRDFGAPGSLAPLIAQLNLIRRENPALHDWRNVTFYRADDDEVIFYGKRTGATVILVAVNLDPFSARDATLWFPTGDLGIADGERYEVEELLDRTRQEWTGSAHRWRLDPQVNPAAIFRMKLA